MAKRYFLLLLSVAFLPLAIWAQKNDPVLFTVEDTPVHKSEFEYIYTKTNGKNADFSRESLEEYLDLYIKFKLKVQKAKEMQLDTIAQLQQELAGYRRQLADSYLIDKEVTEKLLREAYEHSKQDVDISHILFAVAPNASPEDTLAAYKKAEEAKKRLEGGEDFGAMAKELSDDKSAQQNNGRIGYVTALFPNGFYPLEKAAYEAPQGKVAGPVRTSAGYHLLKVHDRRPARGEIEAAHILLRTDSNPELVKARIDSIYRELQAGADFDAMAKALSEDSRTAANGGYIGFFGINKYAPDFENAAFGIEEDGGFSEPVQTNVGWHILKRISRRGIQPYEIEKSRLEAKVKKDTRFERAKEAMVENIKEEAGLKEYPEVLDQFAGTLTDTFLTFRWRAPEEKPSEVLFSFGKDFQKTLGDFTDYLTRASRQRMRQGKDADVRAVLDGLYTDFLNESAMQYEERQLEEKYPDFKALMREYEEGILLFEATKMLVWDKASQDSAGLVDFYDKIRGKYRWNERSVTSLYKMMDTHRSQLDEVREFAKENEPEAVLEKFNTGETPWLLHEAKTIERNIYPEFRNMEWEEGALSQSEPDPRGRSIKFIKIEKILPAAIKTLEEARGYAVADYQDYLEKQWVEQLREEYEVEVNKKAFESMVREKE